MNAHQRRQRRRLRDVYFDAGWASGVDAGADDALERLRHALDLHGMAGDKPDETIKRHVRALADRWSIASARVSLLEGKLRECEGRMTAAEHDARKCTDRLQKQTPLVAELQIALQQVATAVTGVACSHGLLTRVADVNTLRARLLTALKATA